MSKLMVIFILVLKLSNTADLCPKKTARSDVANPSFRAFFTGYITSTVSASSDCSTLTNSTSTGSVSSLDEATTFLM